MHNAQAAATRTAHTAVMGLAAGVLLTVGAGFMTLAAWLLLLTVTTALYAALILGSAFMGAALILLAVMSIRKRNHALHAPMNVAPTPEPTDDILNQMVVTFLAGITAGRKVRS